MKLSVLDRLLKFYSTWYSSNIMYVAVLGKGLIILSVCVPIIAKLVFEYVSRENPSMKKCFDYSSNVILMYEGLLFMMQRVWMNWKVS